MATAPARRRRRDAAQGRLNTCSVGIATHARDSPARPAAHFRRGASRAPRAAGPARRRDRPARSAATLRAVTRSACSISRRCSTVPKSRGRADRRLEHGEHRPRLRRRRRWSPRRPRCRSASRRAARGAAPRAKMARRTRRLPDGSIGAVHEAQAGTSAFLAPGRARACGAAWNDPTSAGVRQARSSRTRRRRRASRGGDRQRRAVQHHGNASCSPCATPARAPSSGIADHG